VKVLAIDDQKENLIILKMFLASGGHQIVQALTGRIGIDQAKAELPQAILLDLQLPDIHGLEVLKELKSMPDTASIPVLIISGTTERAEIDQALALGANDWIAKPVEREVLLGKLSKL